MVAPGYSPLHICEFSPRSRVILRRTQRFVFGERRPCSCMMVFLLVSELLNLTMNMWTYPKCCHLSLVSKNYKSTFAPSFDSVLYISPIFFLVQYYINSLQTIHASSAQYAANRSRYARMMIYASFILFCTDTAYPTSGSSCHSLCYPRSLNVDMLRV